MKLLEKLLKEKELDVSKVVEQMQQNTYNCKDKKHTMPAALKSNREKGIKEEPKHRITHTRKHGTRPQERPNERNWRNCDAPNWNPNQNCPARETVCYKRKKKRYFAKTH